MKNPTQRARQRIIHDYVITDDGQFLTREEDARRFYNSIGPQFQIPKGADMTTDLSSAAAALGRKGGQSTSSAKVAAARENGRKGGRPVGGSMSRRQQIIDAVAAMIADNPYVDEWDTINDDGWTLDIRFDDGDYISDTDWTRVEVTLNADDLNEAIRLAMTM